ncbi:MAG: DUF1499 domain-containing protein [Halioglobus sp.]
MNPQHNMPRLINWLGYFAIGLFLILPLSVLSIRAGQWQQGLPLYAIACFGSALLIVLAIVLLLRRRFAPWRKNILLRALFALPGAALLLALTSGGNHPMIHDISTDAANPPTFTAALQQRGEDSNALTINQDVIQQQQEAYPDLKTLVSSLSTKEAYNRALQVADEMGWEVYQQDSNAGVIEAVDTTRIMGFKDDIAIRVRRGPQGTLVDLRSVSRVGEGDLGANANRIRAFCDAFQQEG